jgi:hypothetical protein
LVTSWSKKRGGQASRRLQQEQGGAPDRQDEGLQPLRNRLHNAPIEESAVDLLRALDCIPLATTQATAYFNQCTRTTVASYLYEFWRNNKKRVSLLNWDKMAEKLNRQALEERKKGLGEGHSDTLTSVYCLAHPLQTLRQYTELAGLYQKACDEYTQQLGFQHLTSVACRSHFAAMRQEAEQAWAA